MKQKRKCVCLRETSKPKPTKTKSGGGAGTLALGKYVRYSPSIAAYAVAPVGLGTSHHVIVVRQNTLQLTTASVVLATNLTPPRE